MQATIKKVIKSIVIAIVALLLLAGALYIVIIIMWTGGGKLYSYDKNITTEYGDTFRITLDNVPLKAEWRISHEVEGEYFSISLGNYYDKEIGIVGIWNTTELRCYEVSGVIILRRDTSKTFERFDKDLYANEDMTPVVLNFLFKGSGTLDTYLPYFLDKFPAKTEEMLQNFIVGEYEKLFEHGFDLDIFNDEYSYNDMLYIVQSYL